MALQTEYDQALGLARMESLGNQTEPQVSALSLREKRIIALGCAVLAILCPAGVVVATVLAK